MAEQRLMGWQKATALVPLTLLSGAWTAGLVGLDGPTAAGTGAALPHGTSVPAEAIEAPASLSAPGAIAPGLPDDAANSVIASASVNGVPDAALAAYQRAAQVIEAADRSCHITWQLIAAIGRVESDHGRYGGNTLSGKGVSTPGIYGIPLDGAKGTARITDTDAGRYDDDTELDRAVGPMQFIPSTWSVVGVDGDGDGVRNPQDIDDAALSTAVYLCSGDEDLSIGADRRTAIYRYNHSEEYVDLVLSVMRAYVDGDYTAVPNGTAGPAFFTPSPGGSVVTTAAQDTREAPRPSRPRSANGPTDGSPGETAPGTGGVDSGGAGGSGGGNSSAGGGGGSTGGGAGGGGDGAEGGAGGGTNPQPDPDPSPPVTEPNPPGGGTPSQPPDPVDETVTPLEEATQYCQSNLTAAELDGIGGLDACTAAYLQGGAAAVQALLDALGGLLGDLPDPLG
ncbi:hypothetical protein BH18ACT9_BH18ACT9_07330 [soil metagenome]